MTKKQYLTLCQEQTTSWLRQCAADPTIHMRPLHIALIKIALRRRGELK